MGRVTRRVPQRRLVAPRSLRVHTRRSAHFDHARYDVISTRVPGGSPLKCVVSTSKPRMIPAVPSLTTHLGGTQYENPRWIVFRFSVSIRTSHKKGCVAEFPSRRKKHPWVQIDPSSSAAAFFSHGSAEWSREKGRDGSLQREGDGEPLQKIRLTRRPLFRL